MHSSHRWAPDDWDKHWGDVGEGAKGNPATAYRQRLIVRNLGDCSGLARILDIGSGQGELAMALAALLPSAQVRGIELSAEGVRRATAAAEERRLTIGFVQRDLLSAAELGPSDQGWATRAVCSEVLEHVDHPDLLLRNARAYLAPGCRMVVTVPAGPRSAFDHYLGHRRHFTRSSLRHVLDQGGFDAIRIDRAGAPFFNLYRLVVMARGRRLVDDLSRSGTSPRPSKTMRLAYRAFDAAFRFNLASTPLGWQLIAVATPKPI